MIQEKLNEGPSLLLYNDDLILFKEWFDIGITVSHLTNAYYPKDIIKEYTRYLGSRQQNKWLPYELQTFNTLANTLAQNYICRLPRARCPYCKQFVPLTKSGALRKHRQQSIFCQVPRNEQLPSTAVDATAHTNHSMAAAKAKVKAFVMKNPDLRSDIRHIRERKDLSRFDQQTMIYNAIKEKRNDIDAADSLFMISEQKL